LSKPEKKSFGEVQAALDKAERKNIYQRNKVARLKARYAKQVGKTVEKVVVKKTKKKLAKKKVIKK
jgi:ribosomal protein S20